MVAIGYLVYNLIYPDNNSEKDYKKTMKFLSDTAGQGQAQGQEINIIFPERVDDTPVINDNVDKCIPQYPSAQPTGAPTGPFPLAGNYYVNDENSANFQSNAINVSKFYTINENASEEQCRKYDGLTENDLSQISNQQCFPRRDENKTFLKEPLPTNWTYKNELPMNGGEIIKNVVGFDSLNDGYSYFQDKNQSCGEGMCSDADLNCNYPLDDIRFGLGFPNEEIRSKN